MRGAVSRRYYEEEHFTAYARVQREGLLQWSDLHRADRTSGYDEFPIRAFLDRVMPAGAATQDRRVFEYGCGTGAAACFLAERGFEVVAVDLVPDAIAIARRCAAERGLAVRFDVEDVCRWGDGTERFDYVVDGYCLQSIVTDTDRARLLTGVRRRLATGGRYVLATAMFEPDREYGDDHYDVETQIVWSPADHDSPDAVQHGGRWYRPYRRHRTAAALRRELTAHGFSVLEQSGQSGGDVVCELTRRG